MKPEFYEPQKNSNHLPRAILVGAENGTPVPSGHSLEELEGLATTAYYDPVAFLTQRLTTINPKTYD